MFDKTFATLEAIYVEMSLRKVFDRVMSKTEDISTDVCLKMLVRC
jgi:hypothetical protein